MLSTLSGFGARSRILSTRILSRFGFREDSFFLVPAVIIGMITAVAAVGFHELIDQIRDFLYVHVSADFLYGSGLPLLIIFPAAGGLAVGVISRYIARTREGHGIIDVMESVVRTSGFVKPATALEKIVTSAVTIGSGGSTGAEGPIVQIGAAISSGVGQLFGFARHQMPILIGCGSAAGISAIFNSPIGGVIFTLEVILQDFSIRTFTPLVVSSVIANVTTRAIFAHFANQSYRAIFTMPAISLGGSGDLLNVSQMFSFVALGTLCGLMGVSLTKLMSITEMQFAKLRRFGAIRPAIGGAMVGILGIVYVLIFGRLAVHSLKPFSVVDYPMPAFYGDGYGIIRVMLKSDFYAGAHLNIILPLLAFIALAKIFATCLTLSSGGSGGIIAPSLFMGAAIGGFFGAVLSHTTLFASARPELYALVGMAAVLSAVVHAPLASILILFELTQDYGVILPAMLATVIATGMARLLFADSIYTHSLRMRGIRLGSSDLGTLRRITVEQIELEPATIVHHTAPVQQLLDLNSQLGTLNFVVVDETSSYLGMIGGEQINNALISHEAIPLMIVDELTRTDIPLVRSSDDLAAVFEAFAELEVSHMPVALGGGSAKVIGLISRHNLMKTYQRSLAS